MDTSKRRKLTERELFVAWVPIHAGTCLLWTWATQPVLVWVFSEMKAWGFEVATLKLTFNAGNIILTGVFNYVLFRVCVSRLIARREEGEPAEMAEDLPEFRGVAACSKVPNSPRPE